jgi:hypothetical protein
MTADSFLWGLESKTNLFVPTSTGSLLGKLSLGILENSTLLLEGSFSLKGKGKR